jgi:four helix bundle protein
MSFNHENLIVYQRVLAFNAKVGTWTAQWDGRHAVCDQLSRAAGSMLENIALASAAYSTMKQRGMDYAIGSCLECVACLDLARVKSLLGADVVCSEKEELSQILRMMVVLRKSWSDNAQVLREDAVEYKVESKDDKARDKGLEMKVLFHHETLDVYRVAIMAAEAFCSSETVSGLPNPTFRRLDELLTSMILNIAEGNGRFSDADQTRFLGTAHESAIKLAARLDLCVTRGMLSGSDVTEWKRLLERVAVMTSSLIASILGKADRQSSRQGSRQRGGERMAPSPGETHSPDQE